MSEKMQGLQGRNIVVTGAAQGIGRAISELVLELGGVVTAVDMNAQGLESLVATSGERVLACVGNVADAAFAPSVVEQSVARFGVVHGLVNNAGVTRTAMIEKMTLEQWQLVIDVHLTGSFHFLQAVGRNMLARARAGDKSGGSIANISSDAAAAARSARSTTAPPRLACWG